MANETLPVVAVDKDRSLQEVLTRLTASRSPMGADAEPIVTAAHRLPAIDASFAPYPDGTDPRLRSALAARGIDQLYTHQAEAFAHVLGGRNVVTITPTASGKTLCYNAPVLNAILQDSAARALYLFPTKALAQDQLAELHALSELITRDSDLQIGVFTYDGDTPSDARRAIRGKAHVVLSNPDMVHSGILPHHPRWAKLFENLRFVIDRRAARVSRRLRQPPRQHPAAAAAHLPALRLRSDLHLLVGHDREPARARRRAHRPSVRAGGEERRAARREVLPVREPAGRQRAARHPALVSGRGAACRARVPAAQPAADPLRAEPPRGRDPHDLSEGRLSRTAGGRGRHPRLSRRVPAESPARDRARAPGRPGARGGLDQRARARASTSARSTSR